MKKIFLAGLLTLVCSSLYFISPAQQLSELPNLGRYAQSNRDVAQQPQNKRKVVFMGNSITEHWAAMRPDFFTANNYIGRGISGQTSPQMLMRFYADVVNLHPVAVVINAGTNDIAENTGAYNPDFTLNNIKSMASIAKANHIKVILSAVLPAAGFKWRTSITDAPQKIDALNQAIKTYAQEQHFAFIDYNTALRDNNGGMKEPLASDGVHPTVAGYEIMEKLAKQTISHLVK